MQSALRKLYEAKWAILGLGLALFLIWISLPFLSPIVFAMFLYYISRPLKRKLHPFIQNEALLALTCLLLLALPLAFILLYVILFAANQLFSLLAQPGLPLAPSTNVSYFLSATSLPVNLTELKSADLGSTLSDWYQKLTLHSDTLVRLRDLLYATGLSLAGAAFSALLTVILAFFLLLYDSRLAHWIKSTFPGLVSERRGLFWRYATAVDDDFEQIFFGNLLNIVFFTLIAATIYWLLGVFAPDPAFVIPVPLLLGVLSGIAALLPLVGGWLIDIPILLYVLIRSLSSGSFEAYWWYWVLMAAVIFVCVENLPNYLLRPFVSHGSVNVGLLMLAYLLGPVIFGFPGLFLGAMLLVIVTHYCRIVVPELNSNNRQAASKADSRERKRSVLTRRWRR